MKTDKKRGGKQLGRKLRGSMISRRTIEVNGQQVHYGVMGQGQPLILVHGLAGSMLWWIENVEYFAKDHRVYLVELPGFGMMRRERRQFALERAPSWLLAWMQAVGIERASLIGHSMGGYICIRLAAEHPEVVERLVLAAPAGLPTGRTLVGYLPPLALAVRYAAPSFLTILFYDFVRMGPVTMLRATQDLLSKNMRDDLKLIKAPTLLIWGEHDTLVPPVMGGILRETMPNARLLRFQDGGHVVMYDCATGFNDMVSRFLEGEEVGE